MDKTIMTGKVQAELSQLFLDIERHMTLKEVHVKENGWSLLLFLEHIKEKVHPEVVELMKSCVGSLGSVRSVLKEETVIQTRQDVNLSMKQERRPERAQCGLAPTRALS